MHLTKICATLVLVVSCYINFSCSLETKDETKSGLLDRLITSYSTNQNTIKHLLDKWIKDDKKLADLLKKIADSSKNENEEAFAIFHQVQEMYRLPKSEEDLTDELYEEYEKLNIEPRTVFQELAIINYLLPKATIRDNVLLAIYTVQFREQIDIMQAAKKYYGSEKKIPKPSYVYFFGKDIDAKISFSIPPGLSWTESGAVQMWQIR